MRAGWHSTSFTTINKERALASRCKKSKPRKGQFSFSSPPILDSETKYATLKENSKFPTPSQDCEGMHGSSYSEEGLQVNQKLKDSIFDILSTERSERTQVSWVWTHYLQKHLLFLYLDDRFDETSYSTPALILSELSSISVVQFSVWY